MSHDPTMTRESWLVFDLLEITGSQYWLPHLFLSCLPKLKEFASNIVVINDLGRGVHLGMDFIKRMDSGHRERHSSQWWRTSR